jgi:type I restriction enzyme S subunit
MSFPQYPKYMESGVEWLGQVPEGWESKPLRSIFRFSKGLTITKENLQDEGVCCVNYGEIHSKYGFRLDPGIHPLRYVDEQYLISNPEALISDGDFVFADTSEDLEGSGNFTHLRYDQKIFAGYHTIIARPRKVVYPLFLAFQFDSSLFRSQIHKDVKGIKVFSVSQGILKGAKCWLPPLPEQIAIASFLDRETAKIDALVAEQNRLIELLKEKRQAVISHAVTKGLNPNAKMKPSGIEWLGDVPEHWELQKVGELCSVISKGTTPVKGFVEENKIPFIRVNNLTFNGNLSFENIVFISRETHNGELFRSIVYPGDVLMNIVGPPLGKISVVSKDWQEYNINQAVSFFRPFRVHSEYLSMWLQSVFSKEWFNIRAKKTSGQANLTLEFCRKLPIALPGQQEQQNIINFLSANLGSIESIEANSEKTIALLNERRSALISAAVTGQIDVRGLVPSEAA